MHEHISETPTSSETEEEIVDDIVNRSELGKEDHRYPGAYIVNLSYGRKSMMLAINIEKFAASTFIDTVRPEEEKKPNETTFLYKAVRALLDRASANMGKKFFYTLRTENEHIKKWAETSGEEIFHWENKMEIPQVGYPVLHVFETHVESQKNQQSNLSK